MIEQIKVVVTKSDLELIKEGLCWDGREKAIYLLCHSSSHGGSLKLMPFKIMVPEEKDYVRRSAGYYELSKHFINRALNEAIDTQTDLLQCHIHPNDPAVFSIIDETEESKFMQHIAEKIDGIYHGSLVFGNSLNTIDGWFFDREKNRIVPIDKVSVIGTDMLEIYLPPRSRLKNFTIDPSLDRTVRAFGTSAVNILGALDFGVVGASALGGPIIEFLARDKVRSILICDSDEIDETNLNRLPGTTLSDVCKPKAEFYAKCVEKISPNIKVVPFQQSFYDQGVQEAFSQTDIIFGCVDSGARLSINRLGLSNLIPYFDLGAGIHIENGKPRFVGGQVYSIIPGRKACLTCTGAFNNFMSEFLSHEEREREIKQGYLKSEEEIINPLVHFLDYAIAGIGYHQMLKYIWGTDDKEIFSVHFNGVPNKLLQSKCENAGCINCQQTGFLGKGDKAPFMLPQKIEDSESKLPLRDKQNRKETLEI
jgi:molybdopterin/thiamine biosynthesis adenylyltransferase